MTEREMLELAAMAAGYPTPDFSNTQWGKPWIFDVGYWSSLDSYGDALRLAVKLEMHITIIGDGMCEVSLPDTRDFNPVFEHDPGGDTGKATCRAITRLAAEIGKAMKEAK